MTAVDPPHPFRRCAPLTLALAAVLYANLPTTAYAGERAGVDTSWIRFRNDPAERLFPSLPAPRSAARNPATAVVRAVTNCDDDGPGSLRATIAAADSGDAVDLTALACGHITLETGAIPILVDDLSVRGADRSATTIDGGDADRVFIHYGGGTLLLRDLTITRGRHRASGFHLGIAGCIASASHLQLERSTVHGCYAGGEGAYGGAIYAYALTMSNSTLSDNHAYGIHDLAGTAAFGGAAFVYSVELHESTISGNRADHRANGTRESYDIGGGLVAILGGTIYDSTIDSNVSNGRGGGLATFSSVLVSNTTISGNVATTEFGGGLFVRWPAAVLLSNSTVADNGAPSAGGLWLNAPGSQLRSSIVARNGGGDIDNASRVGLDPPPTIAIVGTSNLVGTSSSSIELPDGTSNADPLLAPLAHNGGLTRTHALLRGSPAIDAGANPDGLPYDQRGAEFPRVYGAAPDIGAYERQAEHEAGPVLPVPALSAWATAMLGTLLAMFAFARSDRGRRRERA